ncbi:hypothetical protein A4H97_01550 [Niastella yeongjuensis]|uniref:Uncharacterized protein n=1 Tax=Niastella yeongjuensis TaxID=354355 RepID=A0A1V9EWV2_9BACT|nr:hypothetical protein A4H97_01550 [Niastella yeongjuensis]
MEVIWKWHVEAYWILMKVVRFKNRQTTCRAMVLADDTEPLLGARQELIVHPDHPYFAQMKIK